MLPQPDIAAPIDLAVLPPHPVLPRYYDAGAKQQFVRRIFDDGAADYDRVERVMALGSGSWYRRQALMRAGLAAGIKTLDVAIGTGMVAREEIDIVGAQGSVFGIDPSSGMLERSRQSLAIPVIMGIAEQLPICDGSFDFVSMGYALRHVSDLNTALAEFFRVLRPGGRLCILELTRPAGPVRRTLLRWYMSGLLPWVTRIMTGSARSQLLWEYYWDTIESCVPPQRVLAAMRGAGFTDVARHVELGIFSEYTARKP